MPTPTITDDDKGTITATVDGKVVRTWTYTPSAMPHRKLLRFAREYTEGWHNCTEYLAKAEQS